MPSGTSIWQIGQRTDLQVRPGSDLAKPSMRSMVAPSESLEYGARAQIGQRTDVDVRPHMRLGNMR
jgi:hypothetical protein